MIPILLTRPEAQARATAEQLRAAGIAAPIEVAPLMRIEHLPLPAIPDGAALVLTSANGVAAWRAGGGTGWRDAFVVGARTAAAARDAGLRVRHVAADADALASAVPGDAGPVVHLHGAHVRGDLRGALTARGIAAESAIVYAQEARPLTWSARALIAAGPVLCPLYSPRTARLLAAALPEGGGGNLRVVALSAAVAAAAPVPPVATAARPDGAAMERAIIGAFDLICG